MRKTKEILRLKDLGHSHRAICRALDVGLGTISSVLSRARAAGVTAEAAAQLSEDELDRRLFKKPAGEVETQPRAAIDFAAVYAERLKPGVTMQLLHLEYREKQPDGLGYTQFCEYFRRWMRVRRLTMRQEHRAGDKVFVDYSGKRPHIVDPKTGEQVAVELFVGVLGASNFTFAEATASQRVPDFIGSHRRMFEYFGGVTSAVVPDQLKSGVTVASAYEPGLQRTYEDLAEHYGTAIVPARPAKPRDKAKVEVAVQVAQRWILARLRNQTFFSLDELNERIGELRTELNARRMRRYSASRQELFDKVDRPALKPLPTAPYELATWSKATVRTDYHVEVEGHAYSIPFRLVGEMVEMRLLDKVVEVLRRGERVTVHIRGERGGKTTKPEHLPVAHRRHLEWTPERIGAWAAEVGPATARLTAAILADRPHPEQGYRSCLGILRLQKDYGPDRLERACARAFAAGARSYLHVASILKNHLDRLEPAAPADEVPPIAHENVRGAAYFDN